MNASARHVPCHRACWPRTSSRKTTDNVQVALTGKRTYRPQNRCLEGLTGTSRVPGSHCFDGAGRTHTTPETNRGSMMQGLERQLKRYRAFTSEQFLLLANYKHQKFDRRRLTKLKKRRACHTHTRTRRFFPSAAAVSARFGRSMYWKSLFFQHLLCGLRGSVQAPTELGRVSSASGASSCGLSGAATESWDRGLSSDGHVSPWPQGLSL